MNFRTPTTREILLGELFLALLVLWFFWHHHDKKVDEQTSSVVLKPGVIEKIVTNPEKHTLEVITPTSDKTVTLPDRPSSIEISKDNTVVVTSPQFGTELHPFGGFIVSSKFRLGAGIDSLYYKKLDFGLGIADEVGNYIPIVFVKASYNIYGNIQFGIDYGSDGSFGGVLLVRFF